jgi:hypothetical protein
VAQIRATMTVMQVNQGSRNMNARHVQAINRRLDVLRMTLVELARSLPPDEAARAVTMLHRGVNAMTSSQRINEGADAAVGRFGRRPRRCGPCH